jgi:NAD(P) transhydrogenase subunit alpha
MLTVGVPKESRPNEARVAATPDSARRLIKAGFRILLQSGAGEAAGFPDRDFEFDGVERVDAARAFAADVVLKVAKPSQDEILKLKKGSLVICLGEPYAKDGTFEKLAEVGVSCVAMELVPRTSRAQSMDVLSSQANLAGYRAVLEGAARYPRFVPMMMTAAGSAKPARVIVLGAGVAGLQAIGTARRLGAQVEAYDVRPEVKEQILSLGAKFIEIDVGESGVGQGGYARELSDDAKRRQQELLGERLKKADILITTANVPGRRAPTLITEDTVKGMRPGSVIVDMAAPSGGNCPLTEADRVVTKHGVILVGITNYAGLMPSDASSFYARNLVNIVALFLGKDPGLTYDLNDDIIAATLVTHQGAVRFGKGGSA